jgi:hypothetical protein
VENSSSQWPDLSVARQAACRIISEIVLRIDQSQVSVPDPVLKVSCGFIKNGPEDAERGEDASPASLPVISGNTSFP